MRLKMSAMLLAVALVAVACGGDDDAGADTTATDDTGADTTATDDTGADTTATDDTGADTTAADGAAGDECAVDDLELFEPGKLTIATGEPVFPPWMMDDDPTNGEGFESAVAYALADRMGFAAEDVEWVRTGFDEAIAPGAKPYDFNMQQYSIIEERAEVVDFSMPYYFVQKSLVALEGTSAAEATTFDDLAGVRFGATIGTTDLDYIEEVIGIGDAQVYNTQADTFAAMQAGQIDATVVGLPTAFFITAVEIEDAVIAGVFPREDDIGEGMGLLFTRGSELVSCVDAALQTLHDDGTIDAIGNEWLEGGGDIPEISG